MIQASNCTRNRSARSRAAIAVFWSLVVIVLLTACEEELSPSNSAADSTTAISRPSELADTPTQADRVRASATASAEWIAENWSEYESVSYEELFRNVDLYERKSFRFVGKVIQVLDADNDKYQMRISITRDRFSWSDPVYVYYVGVRILEDDFVQFVGTVNGTITYKSVFGGEITIPELRADQLKIVDEDSLTSRLSEVIESASDSPTQIPSDPNSELAKTAPVEPLLASVVPTSQFGDGMWRVGIDIEPGIYSTQGSDRCSWRRLSGFSGDSSEILAISNPDGRVVVEILPSDTGFESIRCGDWISISQIELAEPNASFSDGVWRVGIDIEPGIYSTQGSDRCSWRRLSGFSGDSSEILAISNPDGRVVVEILPSDIGFESIRCGDWGLTSTSTP